MYTFCPECYTIFEIKAAHLGVAGGMAGCGKCRHVYRVLDYLFEDTDSAWQEAADCRRKHEQGATVARPVVKAPQAVPTAPDPVGSRERDEQPEDQSGRLSAWSEQTRVLVKTFKAWFEPDQSTNHAWYKKVVSLNDVLGGAAIGTLVLLLAFQWLSINRFSLSADNDLRWIADRVCRGVECNSSLRTDVSRIALVNREVRRHPRVKDGLLINATLVNEAEFPQAYPVFEITFVGLTGNPVAMRRFQPKDYLGESSLEGQGMPVGLPIQILLEIVDPGTADEELSFQFDFI